MKQVKLLGYLSFSVFFVFLFSCNSGSAPVKSNLEGYQIEDIGNGIQYAVKKSSDGSIAEDGYLVNGAKTGSWTTYYEDGKPKNIYNYLNGKLYGRYMEFSNRCQLSVFAGYENDQFHGTYSKFKFGRPLQETTYVNGQIDGYHKEYGSDGKIQKEMKFKSGKQHGKMRFFDTEGNVTIEYDYENGEKVGGGMK